MSGTSRTNLRFPVGLRRLSPDAPAHSRGSSLVVTLIVLVLITGAGIAGMAGAVLQQRVAGSIQGSTRLFAFTTAALRRCEARVLNDDSRATGPASADVVERFNKGLTGESVDATRAEYFTPALDEASYQAACLIEFNGPVDAAHIGGGLRVPSVGPVVYTVRASGARASSNGAGYQRPATILVSRVIVRR